jgi:hypothetical protein
MVKPVAKRRKVIITCAVTGAIHTPSMSPHLPITADEIADAALGAHEGRRCRGASACPRSGQRRARSAARGVRAVPAAHQAGERRGDQHHDRRGTDDER